MLTFGNRKLGSDVAIFNMSTSQDCPSRKLGLCRTINKGYRCYAQKSEIQYKEHCLNHRRSQEHEWRTKRDTQLLQEFSTRIKRRKLETRYVRYNESGDFHDQSDITKLSFVAGGLKEEFGIITFGYTARSDLCFEGANFLVKGSGFPGKDGQTTVIGKNETPPKGFTICPESAQVHSCRFCNLCKCEFPFNIAFVSH
jgi:hypothetical protein